MTVQHIVQSIREQIITWYEEISGTADARRKRIIQYTGLCVAACLLFGIVIGGYRWYVHRREQSAQKTLSFCLDEYFKAQRSSHASWSDLAERCQRAAETHASSYLYPHFKVLQADAVVRGGDLEGAIQIMQQACGSMRSSDPLYALSQLKYRLMQLDSAHEAVRAQGLAQLEVLAHDQKNIHVDAAQFYLGQYYMAHDQAEKGMQEWRTLLSQRRAQPGMSSPWAELVALKVTQ